MKLKPFVVSVLYGLLATIALAVILRVLGWELNYGAVAGMMAAAHYMGRRS